MNIEVVNNDIEKRIHIIRNIHVMIDRDLAELYGVETKRVNEAVRNNPDKFPDDFYFELNSDEFVALRSKISTTSFSKTRSLPKVFSEQGVYMLATILKSKAASEVTVSIIRTFAEMRSLLSNNRFLIEQLRDLERKQLSYELKTDKQLEQIFHAIEDKSLKPKQGIFFDGQVFDAYVFVSDLIKSAKYSIVLLDNYVDESVLTLLSKRVEGCNAVIYTKSISKQLKLDLQKHNEQYSPIEIKIFKESHDRFLIIDEKEVYHIGASLKDLGKKWFAFSRFDIGALEMLHRV